MKQAITLSTNAHRALSILILSPDIYLCCSQGMNIMGEPLGFVRFIGMDRANISRHRAGMTPTTAMELIRNKLVLEKFSLKTKYDRGGRPIGWFLNRRRLHKLIDLKTVNGKYIKNR